MPALACPSCDTTQEVPEDFIPEDGTTIRCPDCGSSFKALPSGLTALAGDSSSEEQKDEEGTDVPYISGEDTAEEEERTSPRRDDPAVEGRLINELPSEINRPVTLASGRYALNENVHVGKEGSLRLKPGTSITGEQTLFVAEGPVHILGKPDEKVRFLQCGIALKGPHVDGSVVECTVFSGGVGGRGDGGRGFPEHAGGVTLMNTAPASVEIKNCKFEENSSPEQGGGILASHAQLALKDCAIVGNESSKGGGLKCEGDSQVAVVSCTFERNDCYEGSYVGGVGGGIACWRSSLEVKETTFRKNTSDQGGGAIFADSESKFSKQQNVFAENEPDNINRG
jgi:predicted Zn finger-like uncharacterized protein